MAGRIRYKARPVIYQLINTVNGKSYIGQTLNLRKRLREHMCSSKTLNYPLYCSVRKHGWDTFDLVILAECEKSQLNELEMHFIKRHSSKSTENGYNCTSGGDQRDFSPESIMKMSLAMTGRRHPPEIIEKIAAKNRGRKLGPPNPEVVERTRIKLTGRKLSDEHKRKLSEKQIGVSRPVSDDTKAKISASLKVVLNTTEQRQKLSIRTSTAYKNPEQRVKTSLAVKKYWEGKHEKEKRPAL